MNYFRRLTYLVAEIFAIITSIKVCYYLDGHMKWPTFYHKLQTDNFTTTGSALPRRPCNQLIFVYLIEVYHLTEPCLSTIACNLQMRWFGHQRKPDGMLDYCCRLEK